MAARSKVVAKAMGSGEAMTAITNDTAKTPDGAVVRNLLTTATRVAAP